MGPVSGFASKAGRRGTHGAGMGQGERGRRSMAGCVDVGSGAGGWGIDTAGLCVESQGGAAAGAAIGKIIRRLAGVRLLLPCHYSIPLDLRIGLFSSSGYAPLPMSGRRGHGWERRSRTSGRRWRWRRGGGRGTASRTMAGCQRWAVPRRAGKGGGPLSPGTREDKGPGEVTPRMATTAGRSVCPSCP